MRNGEKVEFPGSKGIRNSQSGLALLCLIDGAEHWIPHSQIHDDSEVFEPGHEGTLVLTEWFATKEGLV